MMILIIKKKLLNNLKKIVCNKIRINFIDLNYFMIEFLFSKYNKYHKIFHIILILNIHYNIY